MKYIFKKKLNIFLAALIDAIGFFIFRFLRRPRQGVLETPDTVLLIRLDHIGDVLSATGIPKAIKENYPRCRVIFLTASWTESLFRGNPFVDEVMLFDAPWFSRFRYQRSSKAYNIFQLIGALRERHIDAAVSLRGDLRENLIMALSGVKERVGFGITGGGFLLTREVDYGWDEHENEHPKELLRAMGLNPGNLEPSLYLTKQEEIGFEKRMEGIGLAGRQKFVCLLLGSGAPSKDWPASHVDQFIRLFLERHANHKIVLVGSSQRILSQLSVKSHERLVNLVGETSVRELCLLAKKALYFIGPDSGPTHIAAVLGVPTVFLYSGTNRFDRWKPQEPTATVLRHDVPCSPCESDICRVEGHPCMAKLSPESVLNALEGMTGGIKK